VLTSHNYRVTSVAWSEDGKLASGSYDKKVKIWFVDSTGTFECQSTLTGHSVFSPLFVPLCLYDSCTFSSLSLLIHVLSFRNYRVISVAWSKNGKLASGSVNRTVKILSVGSTGTLECESMLTGHSCE